MKVLQPVSRFLSDYRWHILAAGAVVAFVLGCIGWWRFFSTQPYPTPYPTLPAPQAQPVHPEVTDAGILELQRLLVQLPLPMPDLPWESGRRPIPRPGRGRVGGAECARIAVSRSGAANTIPLMRGHVVICGLGDMSAPCLFSICTETNPVVVIESTPPIRHRMCRSLGIPVIIGDAQRQRTLQAAGAERASRCLP